MDIEHQIEAILLFKNEPVSFTELSKLVNTSLDEVKTALTNLEAFYSKRGIVVVRAENEVTLGTNPNLSALIETVAKEELSRDIGRAGLETLAIILYKGPVSRKDIDYIRGVNSTSILRNLLIRGLIERTEPEGDNRRFSYAPTLKLFEYLGVRSKDGLPEFQEAGKALEEFAHTEHDKGETSEA